MRVSNSNCVLDMTQKLITIEYAREKLGERGQKMTDQQVSDLLNMLRLICNKTIDAVIRNLEIIGEAATKLSNELKEKYSQVPWASMVGMRNKIIHEYMGVDYQVVWETIVSDLPQLKVVVEELLK